MIVRPDTVLGTCEALGASEVEAPWNDWAMGEAAAGAEARLDGTGDFDRLRPPPRTEATAVETVACKDNARSFAADRPASSLLGGASP